MEPHEPKTLFDDLARLRRAWVGGGWSWDSRLSCVASSFGTDLVREAKMAVELVFAHQFDHKTVRKAPPLVADMIEQAGGVRADQLVVATDPVAGLIGYGLWWPWGDDVTISFRVGVTGHRAAAEAARLQGTFGATA